MPSRGAAAVPDPLRALKLEERAWLRKQARVQRELVLSQRRRVAAMSERPAGRPASERTMPAAPA